MGDPHPEYGQTWWGKAKETDFPLMFNTKTSYIGEGQVLTAEEQEKKTSGKGTEYLRLKKIKLAEKEEPKTEAKASSQISEGQFKLIYGELRAIHAIVEKLSGEDTVAEPTPDEISGKDEIDLSEIPF